MNRQSDTTSLGRPDAEREAELLRKLRELQFGSVEVVVHQGRISEIRTITRERFQ